jgi:hypothetical protein
LALLAGPWTAIAGPIPVLPGPLPVAGESELPSFIFPLTSDVTVDWMVVDYSGGLVDGMGNPIPAGGYLYLYQIENTSGVAMDALSLTFGPGTAATILAAGELVGDDLDLATALHPAHAAAVAPTDDAAPGPFAGLAGEEGPFPLVGVTGLLTTVNPVDDNITWTFNPLAAGAEANTLYYLSSKPPIYGNAVAQDSTPPSPWGSLAFGGDPLPVPDPTFQIPEPSSLVLAALGLAGLGLWRRRRG